MKNESIDVILFQVFSPSKKLGFSGLGVNYLSAYLQSKGINAKVLNTPEYYSEGSPYGKICTRIEELDPPIIAISSTSFTNHELLNVCGQLKERFPEKLIIVGGYGPTFRRELVKSDDIDVLVYGEGEYTLEELVRKHKDDEDFSNIRGIVYRNESEVVVNEPREIEPDLDLFPFPDRDIVDDSASNWKNIVLASRGCPFNCTFCAVSKFYSRNRRERSAENVISELLTLVERYGPMEQIEFYDDEFIIRRGRLGEILDEMGKYPSLANLKITFAARASNIVRSEAELRQYKDKIHEIFCGIESFNGDYLRDLNKGGRVVENNVRAVEFLQQNQIGAKYGFITPVQAPNGMYLRDHLPLRFADRLDLGRFVSDLASINNYEKPYDAEEDDRIQLSEPTKRYLELMNHFEQNGRRNVFTVPNQVLLDFFDLVFEYVESGNEKDYHNALKFFECI